MAKSKHFSLLDDLILIIEDSISNSISAVFCESMNEILNKYCWKHHIQDRIKKFKAFSTGQWAKYFQIMQSLRENKSKLEDFLSEICTWRIYCKKNQKIRIIPIVICEIEDANRLVKIVTNDLLPKWVKEFNRKDILGLFDFTGDLLSGQRDSDEFENALSSEIISHAMGTMSNSVGRNNQSNSDNNSNLSLDNGRGTLCKKRSKSEFLKNKDHNEKDPQNYSTKYLKKPVPQIGQKQIKQKRKRRTKKECEEARASGERFYSDVQKGNIPYEDYWNYMSQKNVDKRNAQINEPDQQLLNKRNIRNSNCFKFEKSKEQITKVPHNTAYNTNAENTAIEGHNDGQNLDLEIGAKQDIQMSAQCQTNPGFCKVEQIDKMTSGKKYRKFSKNLQNENLSIQSQPFLSELLNQAVFKERPDLDTNPNEQSQKFLSEVTEFKFDQQGVTFKGNLTPMKVFF